MGTVNRASNNAINTDSEKRRAFVAPLFTAGYGGRYNPIKNEKQHKAMDDERIYL